MLRPKKRREKRNASPCIFYTPLYFLRVAMPPRIWRWALFSSSTSLTCRYSVRLYIGRRSDRSLCTVVINQNCFIQAQIPKQTQVNIYVSVLIDFDFLNDLF